MSQRIKGLYADNVICINTAIQTDCEKTCVLAEELGHYHTTFGDILDQSQLTNRKKEKKARSWAYRRLFPLQAIIDAHRQGIANQHEFAEYLHVTEDFLLEALARYQEMYGKYIALDGYWICLEPLSVVLKDENG